MGNFRKNKIYALLVAAFLFFVPLHTIDAGFQNSNSLLRYKLVFAGGIIVFSAALVYFLKKTKAQKNNERLDTVESVKGRLLKHDDLIEEVDLVKHSKQTTSCMVRGKLYKISLNIYVPKDYEKKRQEALERFEGDQTEDAENALFKIDSTTYISIRELVAAINNNDKFKEEYENYSLFGILNISKNQKMLKVDRDFDPNEFIQFSLGASHWRHYIDVMIKN